MAVFGGAQICGGVPKRIYLPKTCYTYPTMMKFDTVIAYQKNIQKYIGHGTHLLSSVDIKNFSILENANKNCI